MAIISLVGDPGAQFQSKLAGLAERLTRAFELSMAMVAYFIEDTIKQDIEAAGFGERWTDSLQFSMEGSMGNMKLAFTSSQPGFDLFAEGGTITARNNGLLWIPLSGTDAAGVRANAFPGGVRGSRYTRQGRPLLFSVTDRQPKYFGIASVTIPKKFHIQEDVDAVMSNYRQIFADAWSQS